jgi:hypothetical protein
MGGEVRLDIASKRLKSARTALFNDLPETSARLPRGEPRFPLEPRLE